MPTGNVSAPPLLTGPDSTSAGGQQDSLRDQFAFEGSFGCARPIGPHFSSLFTYIVCGGALMGDCLSISFSCCVSHILTDSLVLGSCLFVLNQLFAIIVGVFPR